MISKFWLKNMMISVFCTQKIPNIGITRFYEFDEKLNLTVGRLKWYENEHFYPKRTKYISQNWPHFCILIVLHNFTKYIVSYLGLHFTDYLF